MPKRPTMTGSPGDDPGSHWSRRKELEAGTHRYTMPNGLTADTSRAQPVDGPSEDDPRTTFAVPLYQGESLIDYQQHRVFDSRELEETVSWVSSEPEPDYDTEDFSRWRTENSGTLADYKAQQGGRPPIAKDPQTPEEQGKKGQHKRHSGRAKGSKN
jgi:hypothetical protein